MTASDDPSERAYPSRPFVGVGAVVWQGDRFLLIQRGKPPNVGAWSLPGGAQETGETVAQAAIREIKEEAGIDIVVTGLIDVVDSIRRDDEDRVSFHFTLVDVAAAWTAGEAIAASDAMGAAWFSLDDLDDLDLWAETERVIRKSADMRLKDA